MNKKLIALAVAAAIAPAAAMADSGNVTIYGIMHASIDARDPGTGGTKEETIAISSNSSRLGFKGTEDLGNGLSAVWQIESSIGADGSASTLAGRNTFVGLSSKTAGTVLLGKHDTPYKLGTGSLDVFGDTMGDYNAVIGNVNGTVYFDSRLGNVAAYISPTWSGFHFAAAVVAANESGNSTTSNPSAYSLTGVYSNGPVFGSLSYEKASDTTAAVSTDTGLPVVGVGGEAHATKLGLGYNFGVVKLGFVWEGIKANSTTDPTGSLDRNAFLLNAAYTMGNNVLKAQYAKAGSSDVADTGADQWTIGIDHNFSKRTSVYALYSKMNNDTNSSYGLGQGGAGGAFTPAAAGQDPSVWSLGVRHSF
jgi:predicted porin